MLLEEGLRGSLHYTHFRSPGRRFHGKRVPLKLALAITERRLVVFGGVATTALVNSDWTSPRWEALSVRLEDEDRLELLIDYDKLGEPKVSGQVAVRLRSPNARAIAAEIGERSGRGEIAGGGLEPPTSRL